MPESRATARLVRESMRQEKTPISIPGINLPSGAENLVIKKSANIPALDHQISLVFKACGLRYLLPIASTVRARIRAIPLKTQIRSIRAMKSLLR